MHADGLLLRLTHGCYKICFRCVLTWGSCTSTDCSEQVTTLLQPSIGPTQQDPATVCQASLKADTAIISKKKLLHARRSNVCLFWGYLNCHNLYSVVVQLVILAILILFFFCRFVFCLSANPIVIKWTVDWPHWHPQILSCLTNVSLTCLLPSCLFSPFYSTPPISTRVPPYEPAPASSFFLVKGSFYLALLLVLGIWVSVKCLRQFRL